MVRRPTHNIECPTAIFWSPRGAIAEANVRAARARLLPSRHRQARTHLNPGDPCGIERHGFTLIELTAVIVLMGIMLLMVLPDLESSSRSYVLDSAASEVMAALRFTQARAMSTSVSHGCEFSTADNTLRCFEVTGSPPYPTADHPIKKTPYTVDFDTAPGLGGVAITGVSFTDATVTFDSFGAPDAGGTVTVSLSNCSKTISVLAITGLLSVSDS